MSANRAWSGTFCRLLTYCRERKASQSCNMTRKLLRDSHLRQLRHLRTSTRLCKEPDKDQSIDVVTASVEQDGNLSVSKTKTENVSMAEAKTGHLSVAKATVQNISVAEAKDEDLAVAEAKTENVAVAEAKVEDLAVAEAKTENLAVAEVKTENLAVAEAKTENLAVAEAKVEDLAVAEAKTENLAVAEAKVEDLAVAEAKTENLAVAEAKTENLAVAETKTEDLAVTKAKTEKVSVMNTKKEHLAVAEAKVEAVAVTEAKSEKLSVTDPKVEKLSVAEMKTEHFSVEKTEKQQHSAAAMPRTETLNLTEVKGEKETVSGKSHGNLKKTGTQEELLIPDTKVASVVDGDGTDDDSSSSSDDSSSSSDSESDDDVMLDETVTAAVSDVAASLPGDKQSIKIDLLSKLKSQVKLTMQQQEGQAPKPKPPIDYSEFFKSVQFQGSGSDQIEEEQREAPKQWSVFITNLAINTSQPKLWEMFKSHEATRIYVAPEHKLMGKGRYGIISFATEEAAVNAVSKFSGKNIDGNEVIVKMNVKSRRSNVSKFGEDVKSFKSSGIFNGTLVDIFSKLDVSKGDVVPVEKLGLFEVVEAEDADMSCYYPPRNGFEEMIQWTKQGKLWKFPIDNEQGWEEEQKVGFHEHVFLDNLLDEFPKRGPVRRFMELVTTAMSQNPFLTVQQKHETIIWYRDYFNDKQKVLTEHLGEEGLMAAARSSA